MTLQNDWIRVLIKCKDNVQKQISPLLEVLNRPQPNLGIGAGGDPIKEVDLAAENAIVNVMIVEGFSFTLISEESGTKEFGTTPHSLYVTTDPIDGTTNLVRGIPFYGTSIALSTEPISKAVHSALVTDLYHGTTYTAQKGKGAFCNGKKTSHSENVLLEEAVIGLDLNSYKVHEIVPQLTRLIQKTKHIRHLGANAVELCYVADGTTDAFIDIRGKLRTTDVAAAWLIVHEAGSELTSPSDEAINVPLDPKQKVKFVASANREIHRKILELLKSEKATK